jgi:hypothetical protein
MLGRQELAKNFLKMTKENIIPKENIYKTEEIRFLDRDENYQPNKFLKVIIPTVYCTKKDDGAYAFVRKSLRRNYQEDKT